MMNQLLYIVLIMLYDLLKCYIHICSHTLHAWKKALVEPGSGRGSHPHPLLEKRKEDESIVKRIKHISSQL